MEHQKNIIMREDKQLLLLTHLSQLLNLVTAIGGFIVPLILWLTQKDKVYEMDEEGKKILNFQISMFIYAIVSVPLIFLLGLGIFLLIIIGILVIVFPIINGIKASNGERTDYPMSIQFLK